MTERRDEYYSRDEEGRFETHETEAAARRDAEEILGNCQEEASDNGWPEGTGDVEWGRLVPLGECVASNERESDRSDFDYLIDYNIKDLPDPIEALRSALESVTRERDEAVRRVGELEVECRTLHDKLDALEHPSCSRCGCLLIPDNGPWKCEGGCVADPDVRDA